MKSIIFRLVLALAALTIVPDALAADSDSGDIFLDAKIGKTFGGPGTYAAGYSSTTQSSWGADGGYRWKLNDARSLGFEVGYMHFGNVFSPENDRAFGTDVVSTSAISVGLNNHFLFGDDKAWLFQARIGLMRVKSDESYALTYLGGTTSTGSSSSYSSGAYLGFGLGRRVTQDFSLILGFDYYASDPGMVFLGLEAEYRF